MIKKLLTLAIPSLALATNGVNMIATDTQTRAMGGAGIAYYTSGGHAIGVNPALLTDVTKTEFNVDVTYFAADVSSTVFDSMPLGPVGTDKDDPITASSIPHLDASFIPNISYATRIDDEMSFGFAFIGAAGMGVDYIKNPQVDADGKESDTGKVNSHHKFKSGMMLMKIIPAFSYKINNISFGFAPVLGMGSLSINYDEDPSIVNIDGVKLQSKRPGLLGTNIGGESMVPAFGLELGVDLKVSDELRMGASFKSSLQYTYSKVANFEQFGYAGMLSQVSQYSEANGYGSLDSLTNVDGLLSSLRSLGIPESIVGLVEDATSLSSDYVKQFIDQAEAKESNLDDLTLEQPWEVGVGLSYVFGNNLHFAADYRYIPWSTAKGYKSFGWIDQHIVSMGVEFIRNKLSLRAGFNYGNSPLPDNNGELGIATVEVQDHQIFKQAISMLNVLGFPAISTTHYSCGAGYAFSENFAIDLAVVVSPLATVTRSGDLNPLGSLIYSLPYEFSASMTQTSVSLGVDLKF